MGLLRACLLVSLVGLTDAASSWSYSGSTGPSHWAEMYSTCGQSSQSPVDLETEDAQYNAQLTPFSFNGWGGSGGGNVDNSAQQSCQCSLINNGHSVQVNIDPNCNAYVTGGGLPGTYITSQLHFHWGSDSSKGSEHLLEGDSYPMELHFVHYKKDYGSITGSLGSSDGLAVLGVLFKVSSSDNPNFNTLLSHFSEVQEPGVEVPFDCFALSSLLPSDVSRYLRYSGSLTTPGCQEVVTWTLFPVTVSISEGQLNQFRALVDSEQHHLSDNFRPTQDLYGRIIQSSTLTNTE